MAWFKKKKADPISERAHALSAEIAALEAQIKRLDSQAGESQPQPRLRSTAVPHLGTIKHTARAVDAPSTREPIFEDVDHRHLTARPDAISTPEHYNELGVRKYDLPAFLRRFQNHFRGPSTTNPKLVNYLAAGGIQGLRPLRYEKRVARNRFMVFAVGLFLLLLGVLYVFIRNR